MKWLVIHLTVVTALLGCEDQKKEPARRVMPAAVQDSADHSANLNWDGRSDRGNDVISVSN